MLSQSGLLQEMHRFIQGGVQFFPGFYGDDEAIVCCVHGDGPYSQGGNQYCVDKPDTLGIERRTRRGVTVACGSPPCVPSVLSKWEGPAIVVHHCLYHCYY